MTSWALRSRSARPTRTRRLCDLVRGIAMKLGFPLKEEKTERPTARLEVLGADIDCGKMLAKLADSKVEKYVNQIQEILRRKHVRRADLHTRRDGVDSRRES